MKTKKLYNVYNRTTLEVHHTTSWSVAQGVIRDAIFRGEKVEVTLQTTELDR